MSIGTASTSAGPSVVRLEDVGKRYLKYEDVPLLITRALPFRRGGKRSMLWAIRHVDLDVAPGETVGIIGRNGSGKTTLLRMLAGVTAPTEGTVSVRGRVAPLIALGVGFHPELTGRENVFVNGIILGLSRREVERRFDEIVAFAELEKFIDTPVKFYSSGMFVRLGFSVAVAAIPDVMLVDEVLGVGDLAFQFKSFERMKELCSQGAATVVVSHNLMAVRNLCSRVLVVHDGVARFLGPTDEAISVYYDLLPVGPKAAAGSTDGSGAPVEVLGFQLLGTDGRRTAHLRAGDEAVFRVSARFRRAVNKAAFGFVLKTADDVTAYVDTDYLSAGGSFEASEEVDCDIRFPALLATGSYSAIVGIYWEDEPAGNIESAPLGFYVSGRELVTGIADLGATFHVESRTLSTPEARER